MRWSCSWFLCGLLRNNVTINAALINAAFRHTIDPAVSFRDVVPHRVIIYNLQSTPSIIGTHSFHFKAHRSRSILLFDSRRLLEKSIAARITLGRLLQRTSSCSRACQNQGQKCLSLNREMEGVYCHVWPCP